MNNYQDLSKFHVPDHFRGKPGGYVLLWWAVQATCFHLSPQILYGWRRWLVEKFGLKIGKKVLLRPSISITYPWKVSIGDYSWIGDGAVLYSLGEIEIGANTVISQNCYLCTGSHDYTSPVFDIFAKKITIGREVWLASDVFVAPGVSIGDGVVVGARSTVLQDLPAGMICYGNPARPIRPRIMK